MNEVKILKSVQHVSVKCCLKIYIKICVLYVFCTHVLYHYINLVFKNMSFGSRKGILAFRNSQLAISRGPMSNLVKPGKWTIKRVSMCKINYDLDWFSVILWNTGKTRLTALIIELKCCHICECENEALILWTCRIYLEQEIRSVERGYLSHCFKSRTHDWPRPLWGHSSSLM